MTIKYDVIYADDIGELVKRVNHAIQGGWSLQGGVSVCWAESDEWLNKTYAQAVIYDMEQDDECIKSI